MYNYEIEKADLEFQLDDDDEMWLLDMTNIKVNMKPGYEESSTIAGVTYCHPIGHDPELEDPKAQAQLDLDNRMAICENYEANLSQSSSEDQENSILSIFNIS